MLLFVVGVIVGVVVVVVIGVVVVFVVVGVVAVAVAVAVAAAAAVAVAVGYVMICFVVLSWCTLLLRGPHRQGTVLLGFTLPCSV